MGDPSAASQLVAVARMLVLSTLNSLRRRQGAGAVMVLALLGTFLSIELARFGGRSAWGVTRVLGYVSPERGLHYGSFWVAELWCALVALWAIGGLFAVHGFVKIAIFLGDPSLVGYSLMPEDPFLVHHSCLTAYVHGAILSTDPAANVYDMAFVQDDPGGDAAAGGDVG